MTQSTPRPDFGLCKKLVLPGLVFSHPLTVREAPSKKKPCIFGHCPNCYLTPPIAQIRALSGTMFLPNMRKLLNSHFDFGNGYFDSGKGQR